MSNTERIYYMFQEADCKHWFRDNADMLQLAEYLDKRGCIAPPCNVGQIVWLCTSPENISGYDFDGDGEQKEVFECVVESITFYSKGTHQVRCYCNGKFVAHYLRFSDFGKVIFLTREEAEQALRTPQNDEVR